MPRGGSRKGAGRPPGSKDSTPRVEHKKVSVGLRLEPWIADWLREQPGGITETINKAILYLMMLYHPPSEKEQQKKPPHPPLTS